MTIKHPKKYFWSMQSPTFLQQKGDPVYPLDARLSPPFWKHAYDVMDRFYLQKKGIKPVKRLVWFWVTDTPFTHGKEHYEILYALVPDYQYLTKMKIIQCDLPKELQLISSYHKWNQVLEAPEISKGNPVDIAPYEYMFDCRNLSEYDLLQCVVPWIKRAWMISVDTLDRQILMEIMKGDPTQIFNDE